MFDPLLPGAPAPARPLSPPLIDPAPRAPGISSPPGSRPPAPPHAPAAPAGRPHRGRRRPNRLAAAAGLTLAAVVAGGAGGFLAGRATDDGASVTAPIAEAVPAAVTPTARLIDVAGVVATVEPSVVSISTSVVQRQGPFQFQGEGAGTGVVLDADGHILTNAHVVDGAESVTVTVNGEDRQAAVLGGDRGNDIAVLRLDDPSGVVPATFATGAVAVGDQVVAIGNALALEGSLTVTQGIVSALDRTIDTSQGTLSGLLQTDAAISSGNSGGPLVDASGEVVGINTAVAASSGQRQASNIGFVIPIGDALAIADQVIAGS